MRGCLLVLAFVLVGAVVAVGAVVVVQRGGDADDATLTRRAAQVEVVAAAPESRGTPPNRVDGAVVDYAYEVDGRRYTSSTWLPDRARVAGGLHVCVDPGDPARHSVRTDPTVECGGGPLGSDAVRQAERVAS